MYDRWVITTWGRTGSMVLSEQLFNHLTDIRRGPISWLHNELTGGYSIPTPWTLIHSHSIEQLQYINNEYTGIVYAIRTPSDASISMAISYRLSSWHLHTEKSLAEKQRRLSDPIFKDKWEIYKRELNENDRRNNAKPFYLELSDLTEKRSECCEWNTTASNILKSFRKPIITINYDDWKGDLEKSSKIMNINYIENKELSVIQNTKPLSEQLINYDEIMNWKRSNSKDDLDYIERWSILSINSTNT